MWAVIIPSTQAARDTAASRNVLIELFDKIENFFICLQTYTEVPSSTAIMNVMGKIMAEVLCMLAIATKEIKQRRTSKFIVGAELPSLATRQVLPFPVLPTLVFYQSWDYEGC